MGDLSLQTAVLSDRFEWDRCILSSVQHSHGFFGLCVLASSFLILLLASSFSPPVFASSLCHYQTA